MRKFKVRNQPLPGVGQLFELDTASGLTVSVITHRSGRRDLVVSDGKAEEPIVSAPLTRGEANAVAALLIGVHIEVALTKH
jgi:TrkA domain protein